MNARREPVDLQPKIDRRHAQVVSRQRVRWAHHARRAAADNTAPSSLPAVSTTTPLGNEIRTITCTGAVCARTRRGTGTGHIPSPRRRVLASFNAPTDKPCSAAYRRPATLNHAQRRPAGVRPNAAGAWSTTNASSSPFPPPLRGPHRDKLILTAEVRGLRRAYVQPPGSASGHHLRESRSQVWAINMEQNCEKMRIQQGNLSRQRWVQNKQADRIQLTCA